MPPGSETARFNSDPALIADRGRRTDDVDIRSWLGGDRRFEAVEEVVGLGANGRTLTVLTCPGIEEQVYGYVDGEDEQRLIDSWTPRFRR